MNKAEDNKAIVGRWFTEFWGKTCNLGVVEELAAPDMLLQYSLHEPRRGRTISRPSWTISAEHSPISTSGVRRI